MRSIHIINKNTSILQSVSELYTTKRAYEELIYSDTLHYNKTLLQRCNLNNYLTPNLMYDSEKSEAAKKDIKASGIAVMTFPEGTDWDGNTVKIVIGIAGVGEEHLQILSVIADKMLDADASEKLAAGDVDTVYALLTGKE